MDNYRFRLATWN